MIVRLVVHLMLQQLEAVATAKIVCQISLQTSQPKQAAIAVHKEVPLMHQEQRFVRSALQDRLRMFLLQESHVLHVKMALFLSMEPAYVMYAVLESMRIHL